MIETIELQSTGDWKLALIFDSSQEKASAQCLQLSSAFAQLVGIQFSLYYVIQIF